ncbi:hypothetical protein D3C72_1383020 [compost metagenome]
MLGGGRAGAATDEQHGIGLGDDLARGHDAAIGTDHAGIQRMGVGQAALPADGGADRGIQHAGQRFQFCAGARDDHATAADDDRQARCDQPLRCPFDLGRVRRIAHGREAVVARLRPYLGSIHLMLLHVVWQTQVRGSGLAGGHGAEGAAHRARDLVGAVDRGIPLGEGAVQRFLVEFGQGVLAARADRYVRGNPKHSH